ncbi:type I-E CRISPR-associated endoribonuclease Cas2e [Marinactinospora thermotolerans]|uniref:CRISPR-associated protein, Cas2 family n=1 Tax=Marinactinospora thermotolerans DSM 45154 TaxID=1122192 RepID=A0A1T4QFM9_9ACTN|nr:type I-E CRISPR-associated endoribonuclease Cas2e [Marinactinospora thermotolerans]SKA02301.1 CRISPR-associated protein, Cas2 family [Marinactinospora thermotolerans DSM 45154]
MTVIVLTDCPQGLRGFLTRWLMEISPGVFIGRPSARIRDALWDEVRGYTGKGRALLVHSTDNEQGFTFRTHDHKWHPVDHEGLTLIHRPRDKAEGTTAEPQLKKKGWSKAYQRRRFGNR